MTLNVRDEAGAGPDTILTAVVLHDRRK